MSRIDRRNMLKLTAAGLAGAGVYKGLESAGILPIQAQQAPAIDAGKLHEAHKALGKWIYLTPQKLGGGTHAVDLASGKTLAWISYWNYGDTCPISHHLAAYPSADPYKGFEFVNSTQGGENVLIYGIPTRIKQMGLLDQYGAGQSHLSRALRRPADGADRGHRRDHRHRPGRAHRRSTRTPTASPAPTARRTSAPSSTAPKGNDKTKVLMAFRGDWVAQQQGLAGPATGSTAARCG